MDNMDQQTKTPEPTTQVNEVMLREIYENTRKTKNYMKWQLIITVALVVIPILGMALIIPYVLRSLGSLYGATLQ